MGKIAEVVAAVRHGWLPPFLLGQQLNAMYGETASLGAAGQQIVAADANRVLLAISQPILTGTTISPVLGQIGTMGIMVDATTGWWVVTANQHGTLPQLAWQVCRPGAGNPWAVLQLIWNPPGGTP